MIKVKYECPRHGELSKLINIDNMHLSQFCSICGMPLKLVETDLNTYSEEEKRKLEQEKKDEL